MPSLASTPPFTRSTTTRNSSSTSCSARQFQVVQGTGFNSPRPDHFRVVTLPPADDIDAAIVRIGRFLTSYTQ